jgi:hypothetical protein
MTQAESPNSHRGTLPGAMVIMHAVELGKIRSRILAIRLRTFQAHPAILPPRLLALDRGCRRLSRQSPTWQTAERSASAPEIRREGNGVIQVTDGTRTPGVELHDRLVALLVPLLSCGRSFILKGLRTGMRIATSGRARVQVWRRVWATVSLDMVPAAATTFQSNGRIWSA